MPKETSDQLKVEKIKDLIQKVNAKTLLSDNLINSLEGDYYIGDEEDEYYEDEYYDEEDDYYYNDEDDEDYFADDSLQRIRSLRKPPSESDDYYDPGPPDSYYDDAAEYIDSDDDFDYVGNEDYDYEDDYYYDEAEDRMMIQSSTLSPVVLSPTIQKLTELTLKSLNSGNKKKRKSEHKRRRKTRKSVDRNFDISGKDNRVKRSVIDDHNNSNDNVYNVDNNALDLSKFGTNDLSSDTSELDPQLYDVKLNQEINEPISESSEYISYPYDPHGPYPLYEDDEIYHEAEIYPHSQHEDEEIYYDEFYLDEDDFLQPYPPKKKAPVAARTWLDNVLKFRESLFGKHGKPQIMIHYPKDEDSFVTLTEARRPPLGSKPSVLNAAPLPPVVSIQAPASVVSRPATVISQPALSIQTPGLSISQPAVDIVNTNPGPPADRRPILDIVNNPGVSLTDFVRSQAGTVNPSPVGSLPTSVNELPTSVNTLNTLARLRTTASIEPNDDSATITRFVGDEDLAKIQEILGNDDGHHRKRKRHKKGKHHKKHHHDDYYYHEEPYHDEHYEEHHSSEPYHEKHYELYHEEPYHDRSYHEEPYLEEPYLEEPYHSEPYHSEPYHIEPYHKKHYDDIPYHKVTHHEDPYYSEEPHHHSAYIKYPHHEKSYQEYSIPHEAPFHKHHHTKTFEYDPHITEYEHHHDHHSHLPLYLRSDGSYKPSTELENISPPLSHVHEFPPANVKPYYKHSPTKPSDQSGSFHPPHFLPSKHRILPFSPQQTETAPRGPAFLPKHNQRPASPGWLPNSKVILPQVAPHESSSHPPHPPEVYHHSTSSIYENKPKMQQPQTHLIHPHLIPRPGRQETDGQIDDTQGTTISISIGKQGLQPSISISRGQVSKEDPKKSYNSRPPKQILLSARDNIRPLNVNPLVPPQPSPPSPPAEPPHHYLEQRNLIKIQPRTIELLRKLGFHYKPDDVKREIPAPRLPPRLYDQSPPTLYDPVQSEYLNNKLTFAPPKLNNYLPPTLFDPETSLNRARSAMHDSEKETRENPFLKFVSKDKKNNYYTNIEPPQPVPSAPLNAGIGLGRNIGVGNKDGPSPDNLYKAKLRYPMIPNRKVPAIKFEVYNNSKPVIRFQESDEVYPLKTLSSSERKTLHPNEYLSSGMVDKEKAYKYMSKIRYNNNDPYREEHVVYMKPSVDKNKFISVVEKERLYRKDFPKAVKQVHDKDIVDEFERLYRKDFPRALNERVDEDIEVAKRHVSPSSSQAVPCNNNVTDNCVLVKRNSSSIIYDQQVIPSSQVSSLPLPTQIPRPPFSIAKLPFLPLAKYKTNGIKTKQSIKKYLPTLPSVRSIPQYPIHNSYVLAKLKRKDIPR